MSAIPAKKRTHIKKPSYSNLNLAISSLNIPHKHNLTQRDVTGYRLMHPGSHLSRSCLSTESAVAGQQPHTTEVPLGAKLPMVPGNQVTLVTTEIGKQLQRPSCDFDISSPNETYISNEYNDLHDPHLKAYFKRNEGLNAHLTEMGYCTNEYVICSLNKYNLYRQYLKRLSIDLINKKYKEQFQQECKQIKEEKRQQIQQRRDDRNNPITVRIQKAMQKRMHEDTERLGHFMTKAQLNQDTAEKHQSKKRELDQIRLSKQLQMENEREKRTKIRQIKEESEQKRIQEVVLRKHYEDQKRLYDIAKRNRRAARQRKARLEEQFLRKMQYHSGKAHELKVLAAEHDLRRQQRVIQWENYFTQQLKLQEKRLVRIREQQKAAKMKKPLETLDLTSLATDDAGGDAPIITIVDGGSPRDSEISHASSIPSNASSNFIQNKHATFIIKSVLGTVEKGLPTLQAAIDEFQRVHDREMTDREIFALIHRLTCHGRRGSMVTYNGDSNVFSLTGGISGGHIRFELDAEVARHYNSNKCSYGRRATPVFEAGKSLLQDGVDPSILSETVKALSYRVVKRVFKQCGLKIQPQEIADIAMTILNDVSSSSASDASSVSSIATQSTGIHDVADKVIVELLGLDTASDSTDISKPSDSAMDMLKSIIDEDSINLIALDVVKQALRDETGAGPSGESSDSRTMDEVKEISDRVTALTSDVVKSILLRKQAGSNIPEQALLSQDVLYLEKRVSNLALSILDSVMIKKCPAHHDLSKSDQAESVKSSRVSSAASTLPSDYAARTNAYTSRIIETLLRLKSIMPHPKPSKESKTTPITAIAQCINFDALYKAPKEAFHLNDEEVRGLAQALADKLDALDDSSSSTEGTSPRDGALGELATKVCDQAQISPRSVQSSDSSASKMASKVVEQAIRRGDFTHPATALSDGGASLANNLVMQHMTEAQKFAEDTAENALEDMAKQAQQLADELLKQVRVSDSEADSCDGIADRLAGLIVDYGEEKYLKESLDKKADIMQREVSSIAKELVRELLMSSKTLGKSSSGTRLHKSVSGTTTNTLESAFSDAIGALANTVIKSDPSQERITRTQSEIAIRKLLRVLQEKYEDKEDDSKSVGSSAASFLADEIASSVVTNTQRKMNLQNVSVDTRPDWRVTRAVQVEEDTSRQANELLGAILGELTNLSESKSSTTILTGESNPSDAMTNVSKVLVQRLIPHLVEHFRPPTPPEKKTVGTMKRVIKNPYLPSSSFSDFRMQGISRKEELSSAAEDSETRYVHKRLNDIASTIVTNVVKDDRIHNVRKQDEVQGLVNDLALGIVSNVLTSQTRITTDDNSSSNEIKRTVSKQRTRSRTSLRSKQKESDILLQRALYHEKQTKRDTTRKISRLAVSIVDNINDRQSGSSRVSSAKTGASSEVDQLCNVAIHAMVPNTVTISGTEPSEDDAFINTMVPTSGSEYITSHSEATEDKFIDQLVDKSVIEGEDDANIASEASSIAELMVAKSVLEGQVSSKTAESSVAEILIAGSMAAGQETKSGASSLAEKLVADSMYEADDTKSLASDIAEVLVDNSIIKGEVYTKSPASSIAELVIEDSILKGEHYTKSPASSVAEFAIEQSVIDAQELVKSNASSLAELVIAHSMVAGEERAYSKSPASSLAEDIVRNVENIESNPASGASSLAGDMLMHTMLDIDEAKVKLTNVNKK